MAEVYVSSSIAMTLAQSTGCILAENKTSTQLFHKLFSLYQPYDYTLITNLMH